MIYTILSIDTLEGGDEKIRSKSWSKLKIRTLSQFDIYIYIYIYIILFQNGRKFQDLETVCRIPATSLPIPAKLPSRDM